jgi:hypothetical protein
MDLRLRAALFLNECRGARTSPTIIEETMDICMVNHFLVTGILSLAAFVCRKVSQVEISTLNVWFQINAGVRRSGHDILTNFDSRPLRIFGSALLARLM